MKLTLLHIRSYGNDRYYPLCSHSQMICELLNRKSLTLKQIELIKKYEIEVTYEK